MEEYMEETHEPSLASILLCALGFNFSQKLFKESPCVN
jgi:hypothetical protein